MHHPRNYGSHCRRCIYAIAIAISTMQVLAARPLWHNFMCQKLGHSVLGFLEHVSSTRCTGAHGLVDALLAQCEVHALLPAVRCLDSQFKLEKSRIHP
jgi:hypothetical protein